MPRLQRQISQGHIMMASLAAVWQTTQTLTSFSRGDMVSALLGGLGLAASLAALILLRRKALPEHTIRRAVVPAAVVWLIAQLGVDLIFHHGVAPSTYFNYLIVVTLAFSVWPARSALRLGALSSAMLLLAALLGRGADVLVLNGVFFTAALTGYMSVYNSHLRAAEERAKKAESLVVRDEVTGLLQREAALVQVQNMRSESFPDTTHLALILLEVQELTQINQQHGFGSGDRTLQMVSIVLLRQCGPQDIVARWSGSKFLLTLRNANRREAQGRLEQMLHVLNAEAWPGGPRLNVCAGLAMLAERPELAEVVELAQTRLNAARQDRDTLFNGPAPQQTGEESPAPTVRPPGTL